MSSREIYLPKTEIKVQMVNGQVTVFETMTMKPEPIKALTGFHANTPNDKRDKND